MKKYLLTCFVFSGCLDLDLLQSENGKPLPVDIGTNTTDMAEPPIIFDFTQKSRIGCWNEANAIPVKEGVTFCPGTFLTGGASGQCGVGWFICKINTLTKQECNSIPGVGIANAPMHLDSNQVNPKQAVCGAATDNSQSHFWAACGNTTGKQYAYDIISLPCQGYDQAINCDSGTNTNYWECLNNEPSNIELVKNRVPTDGVWCCTNIIG